MQKKIPKIVSNIFGVFLAFLLGVLTWGGHLMVILEFPEAAKYISDIASTLHADDWAVLGFIGLTLVLVLINLPSTIYPTEEIHGDMPISEAIDYLVNDSTAKLEPSKKVIEGGVEINEEGVEHSDAIRLINEAANTGKLKLWGRREKSPGGGNRIWEQSIREIPQSYWDQAELDWHSPLFNVPDNAQTRPIAWMTSEGINVPSYCELLVSSSQLFNLWPKKFFICRLITNLFNLRIKYPK